MNAKKMWECPVCEDGYDSEYAAEYCCPPSAIDVWVCGECGKHFDFDEEEVAEKCCSEEQTK